VSGLKPGAIIAFEFVERSPGEWVITKVEPRSGSGSPNTKPAAHQGH
jgi:Cu(I)/Ag(I) efflux system membrane fusion protein